LEIQRNLRSLPTRPIVLLVAVLCALAIGLTGWYALAVNAPHRVTGGAVTYVGGFPGPDARDRNERLSQQSPNPETTHGH
jgi:hypothetical protein